jgi:protein-disulfide isomerase
MPGWLGLRFSYLLVLQGFFDYLKFTNFYFTFSAFDITDNSSINMECISYKFLTNTFFSSDIDDIFNVLESDAAKLWGVFGWSEIGLGYFVTNVLLVLFLPHTVSILAILNIFTLPYSLWSVWYQKVKARQWRPLCLIVQVLLWGFFILNCLFGYIRLPELGSSSLIDLLFVGGMYAIGVFGFNLLIPKLAKSGEQEQIKQEINAIKANEEVFKTLLTGQPSYEVNKADSQILFGNPDARLMITILTNPFCNPCAKMHKRVEKLLKDTKGDVCVQYLFSSFNSDLDYANKYFNAVYLEKGQAAAMQLYGEWFDKGKLSQEKFFEPLQLDMTSPDIEAEFQKHEAWKKKTQLRATPAVLVSGYKLPDSYKIEDLRYFTEFNVDVK